MGVGGVAVSVRAGTVRLLKWPGEGKRRKKMENDSNINMNDRHTAVQQEVRLRSIRVRFGESRSIRRYPRTAVAGSFPPSYGRTVQLSAVNKCS